MGIDKYTALQEVPSHGDVIGYVYDYNVLCEWMHEVSQDDLDLVKRRCEIPERGFYSKVYSPQSEMAGALGSRVLRAAMQILCTRSINDLRAIITVVDDMDLKEGKKMSPDALREARCWTLRVRHLIMTLSSLQVNAIVVTWGTIRKRGSPTVYVYRSIEAVVIHVESGTLVRDLHVDQMDLHGILGNFESRSPLYVDSVIVHGRNHRDPRLRRNTLDITKLSFPKHDEEPSQFTCAIYHLIPFIMWNQPPRGNLAVWPDRL